MKKIAAILKKEPMLTVSVLAAALSLFLTPPSAALLREIDWRTLGTLFMMLTVLEGFKQENIFAPVLRLAGRIGTLSGLGLFLVFSVFGRPGGRNSSCPCWPWKISRRCAARC